MTARYVLSCLFALTLFAGGALAQQVQIPLTISDGAGGERVLVFGLDPTATDGIDPHFGEAELPPFPPGGVFEARFAGDQIGIPAMGLGMYRDFRTGDASFEGQVIHQLRYQVGDGTTITISWDFPAWLTGRLQDFITGTFIDVSMVGASSYMVTNPGALNTLKMTLTYTPQPSGEEVERTEQPPSGWRMLSAPVLSMTVQTLANQSLVQGLSDEYPQGAPNIFVTYNGDNTDNSDGNVMGFVPPSGLAGGLEPGRGFFWYLWENAFDPNEPDGESVSAGLPLTVVAAGSVHDDDVVVGFGVEQRAPGADDWFLVGNPFASPFDIAGIDVSSGTLQEAMWRWDPGAWSFGRGVAELGSYVLVDDMASVWDGFFAEVVGHALPLNVTFAANCQNGCPGAVRQQERYRIALVLEGFAGGVPTYDEAAYVSFVDGATEEWDRYDSSKLLPMGSMWAMIAPMGDRFGSQVAKGIESRPLPEGLVTVPVSFSTLAEGSFTISMGARSDVPDSWTIELYDSITGQTVDLRQGGLSFSVSEQTWMDARFDLRVDGQPVSAEPGAGARALSLDAYPNPFSGTSRVAFTLPEAGEVSVRVYDVLGREVAVLIEGERAAGRHSLDLDGSALSGGVYVVRLAAGDVVTTRRVTVVR